MGPMTTATAPAFPTLQTARLRLRETVPGDAAALFAIHGDAQAMRWFGSDPLPDLAAAEHLVTVFAGWRTLPNPGVRWAIERLDQPGLIGTCGLFGWHRPWRRCTIGYELLPAEQGRGLMREALGAAIGWGLQAMDLHRIEAQVHPDNAASWRLLEALGFVREGVMRQQGLWGGQAHDMAAYGLLASEWPAAPRPGAGAASGDQAST